MQLNQQIFKSSILLFEIDLYLMTSILLFEVDLYLITINLNLDPDQAQIACALLVTFLSLIIHICCGTTDW